MSKKYQKVLNDLKSNIFLSESGENADHLLKLADAAVKDLVAHQGKGPIFPVFKTKKMSGIIEDAEVPAAYNFDHESLLSGLHVDMQRSVKANSPYMVKILSLSQALRTSLLI